MNINNNDTAVVVIDPQNDVLDGKGVSWDLVGASVEENHTVENIERIFKAAKQNDFEVFISPHYYYPTDYGWKFAGTVERMMLETREFDHKGALSLDGFLGSGADWLDRYKPFIGSAINLLLLTDEPVEIEESPQPISTHGFRTRSLLRLSWDSGD